MPTGKRYRFKITAYSPDTLPMVRLAEYMRDLSIILGNPDRVHFVELQSGSVEIIHDVEYEAIPKVRDRINGIFTGAALEEVRESYISLDKKLAEDNGTGILASDDKDEKPLEFPGKKAEETGMFGAIEQHGSVDGALIRVGGRDETVPVYLEDNANRIYKCTANRGLAKRISPYLYGPPLRAFGYGKWRRDFFGNWSMEKFTINDFTELTKSSLAEAFTELQNIPGGIKEHDDPIGELNKIRRDNKPN